MPQEALGAIQSDAKLTVELKNTRPVELADFSNSLFALSDEYKRFIAASGHPEIADEARLYVVEIRQGSIITDIVPYAPYVLPFLAEVNTIIRFGGYLKTLFWFLLGKATAAAVEKELGQQPQKLDYENSIKLVEPLVKDNGAQFNVVINVRGDLNTVVALDSLSGNAAQNAARRYIADLEQVRTGMQEKVVLYWYQARNDPKSKAGDRAIIESISPSPVKAVFLSESVKAQLLMKSQNPFTHGYVADVAVETAQGAPVLYRILQIHDVIDLPKPVKKGRGKQKRIGPSQGKLL